MNARLALLRQAAVRCSQPTASPRRFLYTDPIYPYPFKHMNTQVYPSNFKYRENFHWSKHDEKIEGWGVFLFISFWTYFWWSLFHEPLFFLGHANDPDPRLWTDADLGIPPDSTGSYADWLASRRISEEE